MRRIAVTKNLTDDEKAYILDNVAKTDVVDFFASERLLADSDVCKDVEIVLGEPNIETISGMPNLRLIQMSWAGANKYTSSPAGLSDVTVATASGAYGYAISEYILGGLIALYRNTFTYRETMSAGEWKPILEEDTVEGKRTLILGVGDIGTETAKRIKAFGSIPVGMGRSEREVPEGFDEYYTIDDLDTQLPLADIVVIALPGTAETAGMFDSKRFELMKAGSILVNVGRGFIVDTSALIGALNGGHLYGAVIDVMDPEPLPADSPLRKMKNVVLTPHVSGMGWGKNMHTRKRILDIFLENLRRDSKGDDYINVVDFKLGY